MVNDIENVRDSKGRFRKGHSGNPKGKPPGPKLSLIVRDTAKEILLDEDGNKRERLEILIRRLWDFAFDGDMKAAQILFDRGWGKVKDTIAIEGDSGAMGAAIGVPMVYYSSLGEFRADHPGMIKADPSAGEN